MRSKYFNDGLVGNKKIRASFTKTGELIRLFYGSADYKQFIDFFYTGIKINDYNLIYLHNDENNVFSQEYIKDTNVLETDIFNKFYKIRISQVDFVPIDENILVKKYTIVNENTIDLSIKFLVYSKLLTNLNNESCGYSKDDALIQYNHDFSICTFSKEKSCEKQINDVARNINEGVIGGKDYIGMSPDSAIGYDLKTLKAGEEKEITIIVYINKNKEINLLNELDNEINRIRRIDMKKIQEDTEKYWKNYVKAHDELGINKKELNSKIKKIYNRTILLFPLLINDTTGGISAGIEVDEDKTKCGRYSFCWPRDAVFITEALDLIGMKEDTKRFYNVFCRITQNKNGSWEQRFYTDGRLAPSWGYQVDETASVVFGIYAHYKVTRDKKFLKDNLKMIENAIEFLEKYLDDILNGKNKFPKSYDLWEEYEGISLYSIASIFAAFNSMIKIYKEVKPLFIKNRLKIESINKKYRKLESRVIEIKEFCLKNFYDESKKSFVRNTNDKKMDISILGTITPFKMFLPKEKNILNTIDRINLTLRTYTGGYVRYEEDTYMGGYNPWIIATLWMSWYYLEAGEKEKALENFSFVTNTASGHGFLGEQVNNDSMKPSWVIGLTWSHAMYILTLNKLIEEDIL